MKLTKQRLIEIIKEEYQNILNENRVRLSSMDINFRGDQVIDFKEKPQVGAGWINGGFFLFEPEVADYIEGDDMPFERYPLETLSREGQLMAYRHEGFWQPMDTVRERNLLEDLWASGKAPWKTW